jgi:uncharacterized membrane protein
MVTATNANRHERLHPAIAIPLAGMLPLFLGALLSDWAYLRSEQVQWINFAAWLNAGAMVLVGIALLTTLVVGVFGGGTWRAWRISLGLLAATFVMGFVTALLHARDAFATMPGGLVMSLITFVLALAATWAGFRGGRT